jgi:DNA repair exonuclease SbcCD ATPase subunit
MSKLVFMERENPTVSVTPEDHAEMVKELKALREEKKTWTKRHEAIWALRDEDVENNIKIRGMLAKARRELEGMTKLRDDDLVNLQLVRSRLAEATRKLDKFETSGASAGGRASPNRGRPPSMFMERRGTMDLFAAAKAAALEQRALELEQRNGDLLSQIETLKGGASLDTINSMTAHKAWKDTVSDLELKVKAKDAELSRLRAGGATGGVAAGSGSGMEWHRVEAIHEDHASYREKVGAKMQALRSEKEALQRELHRKEDENHSLEVKVQSLQRRVSLI